MSTQLLFLFSCGKQVHISTVICVFVGANTSKTFNKADATEMDDVKWLTGATTLLHRKCSFADAKKPQPKEIF